MQKNIMTLVLLISSVTAVANEVPLKKKRSEVVEGTFLGSTRLYDLKEQFDKQLKAVDPLIRFGASAGLIAASFWALGEDTKTDIRATFKNISQATSSLTGTAIYLIPFGILGYVLVDSCLDLTAAPPEPYEYEERAARKALRK